LFYKIEILTVFWTGQIKNCYLWTCYFFDFYTVYTVHVHVSIEVHMAT
jgi:hypothetical protein